MIKTIVEWGKPAKISGRIYHRGSIELPNLNEPVDIMLLNNQEQYKKIGEAYLHEDEEGIYVKSYNLGVDEDYLTNMMNEQFENHKHKVGKYDNGMTIALKGRMKNEYDIENELQFVFLNYHLISDESIEKIVHDLMLNSLV